VSERDQRAVVRPALALAVVCIGYSMVVVDTTIVNVALPAIATDLHAGLDAQQWSVDGYVLVLAALLLSGGALADRLGTLRAFRIGVALFTVTSALCGAAPDPAFLVGARLLQGAAAAVLIPAAMALIARAYPGNDSRARAIALFTTIAGSPQAFGPIIGGLLVGALGWRSVFYVNLPIGAAALILAALPGMPDAPARRDRDPDLPGQIAAVLTLAGTATLLIEGHAAGWASPQALGGAAVAAAAAAWLVLRERSAPHPMLPAELLRSPRLPSYVGIGLLLFAAYYGLVFTLSLYQQQDRHLDATAAGVEFLPSALPIFLLPVVAGRLAKRFGPHRVVAAGLALAVVGALVLAAVPTSRPALGVEVALALLGSGVGLTVGPQIAMVIGTVPQDRAGIASGLLNAGRQTGYVLGVAVLGGIAATPPGLGGVRRAALAAATILLASLCMTRPPRAGRTSQGRPGEASAAKSAMSADDRAATG
jgi:MFS transporter, DHA2 family, methylenomycin A resistance protein